MTLEHEFEMNKTNETKGILKKINSFKFLAKSALIGDILSVITKLSKVFQKESVDIEQTNDMLLCCKNTLELYVDNDGPVLTDTMSAISQDGFYHGVKLAFFSQQSKDQILSLKKKYIQCVLSKIDERFTPQSMHVLQCMNSVLNPKLLPQRNADISNYGDKELSTI